MKDICLFYFFLWAHGVLGCGSIGPRMGKSDTRSTAENDSVVILGNLSIDKNIISESSLYFYILCFRASKEIDKTLNRYLQNFSILQTNII